MSVKSQLLGFSVVYLMYSVSCFMLAPQRISESAIFTFLDLMLSVLKEITNLSLR